MGFLREFSLACALLLSAISPCSADVVFTSPAPGAQLSGASGLQIQFQDSGNAPSISDLKSYQLFLCAGGDAAANQIQIKLLDTASSFSTLSFKSDPITLTLGGSTTNAYFLKIISAATAGSVTNFSPRFSLTDMTGSFPADIQTALSSISGTNAPPTINNIGAAGAAATTAAPAAPSGSFAIPYEMQTGPIRYAPAPNPPGSKITKKKTAPLHPTSAFNIAKGLLPLPTVQTTVTAGPPAGPASIANTAAPRGMPMDDMQKFLNRWKD